MLNIQNTVVLNIVIALTSLLKCNNKSLVKKLNRLLQLPLLAIFMAPIANADQYKFEYFESQLDYFKKLTLGQYANNNDKRVIKWVDDINIYVKGDMPSFLSSELDSIIAELNQIIDAIKLTRVISEEHANFIIFLESAEDYLNIYPKVPLDYIEKGGVSSIYPNLDSEIFEGSMFMDIPRFRDDIVRRHVLRKLLTQSLGIPFESPRYVDSIFAEHPFAQIVIEYSNFDKTIIKKLYDECIKAGMDKFELDHALLNRC